MSRAVDEDSKQSRTMPESGLFAILRQIRDNLPLFYRWAEEKWDTGAGLGFAIYFKRM